MEKVHAVYDHKGKLICACTHAMLAKSLAAYCGMPANEVRGQMGDTRKLWAKMRRRGLTIRPGLLNTTQ